MNRLFAGVLVWIALLPSMALAQVPTQLLRDVWIATPQELIQVDYHGLPTELVLQNPNDSQRAFKALAFEHPRLGTAGGAFRSLLAVDGTKLLRFEDGTNQLVPETVLLDAARDPSGLTAVTAVAVTETGTVLFSGYSRRKRVFELWELDPENSRVQLKVTGTPQFTDAVYVNAEDVPDGSRLQGGGLIAAADRQILFFPASQQHRTAIALFDSRNLPIRNNTKLLSVDVLAGADVLMVATAERSVLLTSPTPGAVLTFANVPNITGRNCADLRDQRLLVRIAQSGERSRLILTDVCGQVLRYDFRYDSNAGTVTIDALDRIAYKDGFVALAVGEGNVITCEAGVTCMLTQGFEADIDSTEDTELLVLQLNNLCDRRVANTECAAGVTLAGNYLSFNSLLPQTLRDALAKNGVLITIPPYMYGAGPNANFGALLVQSNSLGAAAKATAVLDIATLLGFELGVSQSFARGTPLLQLLNQDVAAYAPDNPAVPTVRGFEATPVTTGEGSLKIGTRGFSVVMYGLQHDLNAAGERRTTGGLPALSSGAPPQCNLTMNSQSYTAPADPRYYFFNLSACLFADVEIALTQQSDPGWLKDEYFVNSSDRGTLVDRLGNVKDKLIKALSATGASAGNTNLESVLSQLDQFDAAVAATQFKPQFAIYKNELSVRSEVLRFNLLYRALPSLPVGGF